MAEQKVCASCGNEILVTIAMCPHCSNDPDQPVPVTAERVTAERVGALKVEVAVAGVRVEMAAENSVLLGRQGDDPIATALTRFDNVSRQHATIRVLTDGSIEACDVESRNGTFVGDLRLTPHTPVVLPLPATIRLARFCFVDLHAVP